MKKPTVMKSSLLLKLLALSVCLAAFLGSSGCCNTCTINAGASNAYMEYTYTDCDGVMHSRSVYAGSGSYTINNCSSATVIYVEYWTT